METLSIRAVAICSLLATLATAAPAADPWVVYKGTAGPGVGKRIVFVTGDEEYRSEESMPQLAKILAARQGFTCTVLFAIDPKTGAIDPTVNDNIPGLEALQDADLLVMFLRWRDLPDEQMKWIADYANSGRPMIGLRTSTHPFRFQKHKAGPYAKWTFDAKGETAGGFGRQVFGETWIDHYGAHQKESTRGLIADGMKDNPILRGCDDIWGPSDVYALTTLHGDCRPLVMGQVLSGMKPTDPPNPAKKLVPVAWTKTYTGSGTGILPVGSSGTGILPVKPSRVFTTTMGHADDLKNESFRRLLVNASFWALGMEDQIPPRANVDLVGPYDPSPIGFGKHKKDVRPADLAGF
jgi:hypothetical protein